MLLSKDSAEVKQVTDLTQLLLAVCMAENKLSSVTCVALLNALQTMALATIATDDVPGRAHAAMLRGLDEVRATVNASSEADLKHAVEYVARVYQAFTLTAEQMSTAKMVASAISQALNKQGKPQ